MPLADESITQMKTKITTGSKGESRPLHVWKAQQAISQTTLELHKQVSGLLADGEKVDGAKVNAAIDAIESMRETLELAFQKLEAARDAVEYLQTNLQSIVLAVEITVA